ncbi:hypothetical protein I5907_19015 [Panacibacter sp. DH6]|uniref:Lipoprotein n=1 Tax=Panacibacter microcysteis TaxID=2793269 RepID=A0A931MD10_9BACT|nr:hypothetical protein [Panacibacter microcysteis]MBG9378337.1 hypothetical protein [Panacibacter microcysteis]
MKRLTAILLLFIFAACNNNPSPAETEARLKQTMLSYLFKENAKGDTSAIKFRIDKVYYFDNKVNYNCEFYVHMVIPGKVDTTGVMKAIVSKDYTDVKRLY